MRITGKAALGVVSAPALLLATLPATTASTSARADAPIMHNVKYTVSAANPIYADIYYLDQEPPIFSDYSHNPYQFVPNIQADIAPGKPWTYELVLAKPEQWAFFTASTGPEPGSPNFHCDLTVDGAVVASDDGPRGVLCSIRHW